MRSTIEQEELNNVSLKSSKFVTFIIDNETYGIDVNRVQEIIGVIPIAHIPNSAEYLKGVINLRGRVVPVIDVRMKFRMKEREYDSTTVILIVEMNENAVGLIVDSVSDVLDIPADSMHDYSGADAKIKSTSIERIASVNNELILILNLDKMIEEGEIASLEIEQG